MSEAKQYALDPLAPFPPSWRDRLGPIEVMTNPVRGYVMCRRPGCVPFVLSVKNLCNVAKHPIHGPFELVGGEGK